MFDCFWWSIEACNGECCKCEKYLSTNSDFGGYMCEQYQKEVDDALVELRDRYRSYRNGFTTINI